ncbi:MAG: carboxypeptidase regulatory-like domain-containing protein [Methanoregula sp.]|nr:carboxypeptidase regulatory-like domain-containing protein [Methanoregula sp.]
MYKYLIRFLSILLFVIVICGTVQATNLQVTVQDSLDNTSISQATVYVDGANMGRTTSAGMFAFVHSGLSDLDLRVTKSGYDEWENTLASNLTSVLVNMTRKTLVLKVSLYDTDSLSPVPNADVKITANNATETKKSDSNGIASFAVKANTIYDIVISAPYYQSRGPLPVEIGADNKDVQDWLLRNDRFSFVVTDKANTPVPDAEVYMSTVLKGTTDARGILVLPLERSKTYAIEIKKAGYQSFIERKAIGEDEALLTIQISKVPVGAFVSVFDENQVPVKDAGVYLDQVYAGSTDQYGRYVFGSIVAGTYQVEVKKDGYVATEKKIMVIKQGDDFILELPYEQVDLTVYVRDKDQKMIPGAAIELSGRLVGATNENGQVVTKLKYNTLYNITASKEGYQPVFTRKEIIIGNASGTVTLTMEKNLDWGFIILIVAGAIGVLVVFAIIRRMGQKPRRHIIRRNEI